MKYKVYRIENTINGKFYYGVQRINNKHYFGGGKYLKKAISKYGKNNFIKRTIMEFETAREAYNLESLIVDQDLVNRSDCYNASLGGETPRCKSQNKSIILDGVLYESIGEASSVTGIPRSTIRGRLNLNRKQRKGQRIFNVEYASES